jgi:glycosyltransferase involved in cell wall biosynthesis
MLDTLEDLYFAHHGKVSDKWSLYIATYERVFSKYKNASIDLLEIGVQNGGSLELWAKYFLHAKHIVGCDINADCKKLEFDDPRISLIVGDANTTETEAEISAASPVFDVIVDDGSHESGDIIKTFGRYFPRLSDGGIFIIEDLHCSYWQSFEGGIFDPASSMSFFKRLTDVVNREHWGVDGKSTEILSSFERQYGMTFDQEVLSHIHSIEFANSLCLIRKKEPKSNVLGRRVVVGDAALVDPRSIPLNGSYSSEPDESRNTWSVLNKMPEDRLKELTNAIAEGYADSKKKEMEIFEAKEKIARLTKSEEEKEGRIAELISQLDDARAEAIDGAKKTESLAKKLRQRLLILERDSEILTLKNENSSETITQLSSSLKEMHRSQRQVEELHSIAQDRVTELLESTSWKVTAPGRWIGTQRLKVKRATDLFPSLLKRAKGIRQLTSRGIQVFRQQGVEGVLKSLRTIEAEDAGHVLWQEPKLLSGEDLSPDGRAQKIFKDQQSELTVEDMRRQIAGFQVTPLISIIMPVYKTPVKWLSRAIESLQDQVYENWELCVVDDCSPTEEQRKVLDDFARIDSRIKPHFSAKNGGISVASNIALDMASGEYIALLDHDDELTPDALFWVAKTINAEPAVDFIYTDECKIDDTPDKKLFHFVFKPGWSPEILFNGMVTGHLTIYKTEVVRELNGFRSAYDFSQDYDLALRMSKTAGKILHLERVLYLWRSIPGSAASGGKDFARESNIAALENFARGNGIDATAKPLPHANYLHVKLPESLKVSIVIPSDSYENLGLAINEIIGKTEFVNYEVIAVCNGPLADRMAPDYSSQSRVIFSKYDKKYNFSDKCNQGALEASGDIVVFYNDDVFPISPDWIEKLVEYLYVPGVGGVSPKLLYKNEAIQYAGMISGTPGLCGTAYNHVHKDASDSFLSMHKYVRNVSILSGACCAFKKEIFWKVGGFDPVNTPDGHSDMDLSYKIMKLGLRCVYTPYSLLFHIGNHSWGAKKSKYKADIFALKRWGKYVSEDLYFSDSMKKVLYSDFQFNYKIYASHVDKDAKYDGPDVLFVAHELSLTGAPRMLFHAAKAVLDAGGFPVVIAPCDGPMRLELMNAGIVVILDESLGANHFLFERFAINFDAVVVNTVAMVGVVRQLVKFESLNIMWWLHEARMLKKFFDRLDFELDDVKLICVSEYARGFLPSRYDSDVLYNAVPAIAHKHSIRREDGPFVFLVVGTLEPRKGQDIFADAILLLSPEMRNSCKFLVVGKLWELHHEYWNDVKQRMSDIPQFLYVGMLPHAEVLDLIAESDVLVCASRDEPFSLSVVEGSLMEKLPLLNHSVGVSEVMQHGESCLIFNAEDPASLAEQMKFAFENRDRVVEIGASAKRICEKTFSLEEFSEYFLKRILSH